ncbi:MAG TPA: threonine synthase, partial [Dehalococcoidia bacterium]|nr:threonine synthase [Dehalococcoidia bacterium]
MATLLERYREFLPVTDQTPLLTLGEGGTPLVRADSALEDRLGGPELYFKLEGCNPTGSFKDRGMVMAVAKAAEAGSRALICASTGNTSSSAAAFAARFRLDCVVLIPNGKIALGKLAQALIYGAQVLAIDGNYDRGLEVVRDLQERHAVTVVNSINPYRLEGQKTAAFEIVDTLGEAPDILAIPVGNAGNITAYWRGFREYQAAGRSRRLPRMYGMQAAGAASMVEDRVIPHPETIATAIRIGNPAS